MRAWFFRKSAPASKWVAVFAQSLKPRPRSYIVGRVSLGLGQKKLGQLWQCCRISPSRDVDFSCKVKSKVAFSFSVFPSADSVVTGSFWGRNLVFSELGSFVFCKDSFEEVAGTEVCSNFHLSARLNFNLLLHFFFFFSFVAKWFTIQSVGQPIILYIVRQGSLT